MSDESESFSDSDQVELIVGHHFPVYDVTNVNDDDDDMQIETNKSENNESTEDTKPDPDKTEAEPDPDKNDKNDKSEKKEKNNKLVPVLLPNAKSLNPVIQRSDNSAGYSDSSTDEEAYEVEKVVNHRKIKGKLQFLLKWVGYSSSENTWEDEDNLNCPKLVMEYWKNHKKENDEKINRYVENFSKRNTGRKNASEPIITNNGGVKVNNKTENNNNNKISKIDEILNISGTGDLNSKLEKKITKPASDSTRKIELFPKRDILNTDKTTEKKEKSTNGASNEKNNFIKQIRCMALPLYHTAKPKFHIKAIIGHKADKEEMFYRSLLMNDDIISLSSDTVQRCNPDMLYDYLTK